jgi:hypothetical protein
MGQEPLVVLSSRDGSKRAWLKSLPDGTYVLELEIIGADQKNVDWKEYTGFSPSGCLFMPEKISPESAIKRAKAYLTWLS